MALERNVLIVEDDKGVGVLVTRILTGIAQPPYNVVVRKNLEDAVKYAQANSGSIAVLVTDNDFPLNSSGDEDKDAGIVLLGMAPKLAPYAVPVLMSGRLTPEHITNAASLGVTRCIEKPFLPSSFLAIVNDAYAAAVSRYMKSEQGNKHHEDRPVLHQQN